MAVDIDREMLAGGATTHYEEEQELLEYGCLQSNLSGGGIYIDTGEIAHASIINNRPGKGNNSNEIKSKEIRDKFKSIIKKLIPYEKY